MGYGHSRTFANPEVRLTRRSSESSGFNFILKTDDEVIRISYTPDISVICDFG
jgi:hypothetical protein